MPMQSPSLINSPKPIESVQANSVPTTVSQFYENDNYLSQPVVPSIRSTMQSPKFHVIRGESTIVRRARYIRRQEKNNEARYCRIRHTSYQALCGIFGALEMAVGNASTMLKIVIAVHQSTNKITQKDFTQHKVPVWLNVVDYIAFALLSLSGLALINASGVCQKGTKSMSLTHSLLASLTAVLMILCTVFLIPHYSIGFSGIPPPILLFYGNILHGLPLIILIPATFFSFGLYKVMKMHEQLTKLRSKQKQFSKTNTTVDTVVSTASASFFSNPKRSAKEVNINHALQ